MSYRAILTESASTADDYMLYLMACGYDEEILGKALHYQPMLKVDWKFWEAMGLLVPGDSGNDVTRVTRLKEMLQAAARVSSSGMVVTPSLACMSICLQLEHEGRIVNLKPDQKPSALYSGMAPCPYFQLVPAAKKLALATHGEAVSKRHSKGGMSPRVFGVLPFNGLLDPFGIFLGGDYIYVGDFYNIGWSSLEVSFHRKAVGPNGRSALDVVADWLTKEFPDPYGPGDCVFHVRLQDYLSLRYCHGGWPMEPIHCEPSCELDSKALEVSKEVALEYCSNWHRAFLLWRCRSSTFIEPRPDQADLRGVPNPLEDDPEAILSFEMSLAMLDHHDRKEDAAAAKRYERLRSDVWQVTRRLYENKSSHRSIRTDVERDELLAISRVPFTPSWQGELQNAPCSLEVLSG